MKQTIKFLSMLLLFATLSVSFTSCGDDDDDTPTGTVGKITIKNSSTYTLSSFVVIFINDDDELITREEKGTLKPESSVQADVPIGATKYYMGTAIGGKMFWSVNYKINVKNQVLTDQTVGQWKSNS